MVTGKTRALLRWHRRAGKDKACWCYMIMKAATVPGNYYYVFPTSTQGRKALWETVDKDGFSAVDHIPKELGANVNSQEMRIILPLPDEKRSIIRIIGLDKNKDGIRGVSCKGAVFSEFAYQDPDAYKTLMPSLMESEGWCIFNSTPQGNNHMWDLEQAVKQNIASKGESSDWFMSHLQTTDPYGDDYSGVFTEKQLDEIQTIEGFSDEEKQREYGACYAAGAKGSIYGDHIKTAREEGRIGAYHYDNQYPVHTFWDLGYNDPTSILFAQYIGSEIRFIDYWEQDKKEIPEIVTEALVAKGYKYLEHHLPHDANNKYGLMVTKKELLEQCLRSNGLDSFVTVVPKGPIQQGIQAAQSKFGKYTFNAMTCGEAIEMIALYHRKWDSTRKIFLKDPVHDWTSHIADALRTEAMSGTCKYIDNNKIEVIDDYNPLS